MTPAAAATARIAEGLLTTAAGAGLGGVVGYLLGGWPLTVAAGASAAINGTFGGFRRVYDWRRPRGWFAFVADSTWGLIGTTLGNLANLANLAQRDAGYRADFSRRQNRHVFERGACVKRGFAFTQGNVISNASTGRQAPAEERRPFIDRHEGLHIWQNRLFGPLYQAIYVTWFALGILVALVAWALKRKPPTLRRLVETAAYYDNPFEYWAYKRDEHWEDNSADPLLKWRPPQWAKRRNPP